MVTLVERERGELVTKDTCSECLYKLVVVFVAKDKGVLDIRAESIHIPATSMDDARMLVKESLRGFEQRNPKTNICLKSLLALSLNGGIPQPYFITL